MPVSAESYDVSKQYMKYLLHYSHKHDVFCIPFVYLHKESLEVNCIFDWVIPTYIPTYIYGSAYRRHVNGHEIRFPVTSLSFLFFTIASANVGNLPNVEWEGMYMCNHN